MSSAASQRVRAVDHQLLSSWVVISRWTKATVVKLLGQNRETSPRGEEKLLDLVLWTPAFMACASRADVWNRPAGPEDKELWLLAGLFVGLSVLPCTSSPELLSARLCLRQQNLTGWSRRQPSQPSSTGCLRGWAAFQERRLSSNPRQVPRAKAGFKQSVSSGGVTQLKIDGCPGAWTFLRREEATEEESNQKSKTREFSYFALFLFWWLQTSYICWADTDAKLMLVPEKVRTVRLYLPRDECSRAQQTLGHALLSCIRVSGWPGMLWIISGRLEHVVQVPKAKKQQSVVMLLESSSGEGMNGTCRHLY